MTNESPNSALPMSTIGVPGTDAASVTIPALQYVFPNERQTDLSKFDGTQMARVEQIAASISFDDTNSLLTFGTEPQRRLNDYLGQLLEGIRTSDVGAAGDLTIELATTVKALNLQKMKREVDGEDWVAATFGRLPVVGKWASALRYFQLSHKQITKHLDTIETRAEQDKAKLAAMNAKLDRMVDASIENMRELEFYLAAAQVVIKRARVDFEQRRQAAAVSRDVVEIAKLRDYMEQINAFETRAVRMHIAYAESMVSVPQIRASQTASRIEISNIMDTILFDLPHLKRAIVQVASLAATSKASRTNAARRELTRQISGIGADQLQDVYLKAKASQGSSEQDIALLAQSADKLLETIALGHKLDAENARKREQAISDIAALKHKFVDGLIASGDAFVASTARS